MHIGILQTGHPDPRLAARLGEYDAMFADLLAGRGFRFTTWNVVDDIFPDNVTAAEGWLITGSPHGVYEEHGFIAPLEDFVRELRHREQPLVGICFGHQVIAQALGGRVEKFAGGWQVGHVPYTVGDTTLRLIAWHQDQVIEPPRDARVIATAEGCEIAGMAIGPRTLTLQAHPEFDDAVLQGLIETRGHQLDAETREAARAALGGPLDRAAAADLIATTLRGGRDG